MSVKYGMDTNISNYTDDELLDVIGLKHTANKSDIENRLSKIIKKYSDKHEQQYVDFFISRIVKIT